MTRFPGSLALLLAALLSAPVLHAQQPTPSETRARALTSLVAPAAPQAPFAVSAYTYEFLDPSQTPPAYLLFLSGTRTFSDGRVSEEIDRVPDFMSGSNNLVNQSRTTFTYDAGRLASETQYSWTAGAWVPTYRASYSYNAAGQVTVELEEEFVAGAWQNDDRTTTTYVGGLPSQILWEDWQSGAWGPQERTTVSESGGMAVVVSEEWNGTAYVNSTRTTYAASVQAIFDASNAISGAEISTGFFDFFQPDRMLTMFIYALSYTSEAWDVGTSAWVNDERTRTTVDNATTLQTVSEDWDVATNAWVATDRTTLTFAGNRTQDILIESSDDGTTFTPDSRIVYTYDASGNATRVEFFVDEEEDGTLDTPATSRITLTYTDLATDTEEDAAPLASTSRLTSVQPTPTAGHTDISFVVTQAGQVTVRVFDALGREVARLANETMAAGPHTVTLDAATLPGGVYVVRLETGGTTSTRALVVAH